MPRAVEKIRLDRLVWARGLAPTREQARALVLAGEILVGGQKIDKPGTAVASGAELRLLGPRRPFASRGGPKLAAALDAFHIDPAGCVCLDVGSSTGGFTDCLLQRGALRVHALDAGTNQMEWRLRNDSRVRLREQFNARYLRPDDLGETINLAVVDVSFISVTLLLPALAAVLEPGGQIIVLVKPQFEAGRGQVGKGGIVRDAAVQQAAVQRVRAALLQAGLEPGEEIASPILGSRGNREFLLAARRPAGDARTT